MFDTILTALEHRSDDRSYAYQAGEQQAIIRVQNALDRVQEDFRSILYPEAMTLPPIDWRPNDELVRDYFAGQADCFDRVLALDI